MIDRYTPALARSVQLREGTSDEEVWSATFSGLYHVPPARMPTPATVLDLGANIGLTAAHYAVLWPESHITAVELDPDNVMQAFANWPVSALPRGGGCVLTGAVVADSRDTRGYNPNAAAEAYALGAGSEPPAHRFTLAYLAKRRGSVDFVKMDIEGMEWALLDQDEWAPLVRHLLVELHLPGHADEDVRLLGATRLARLGFSSEPSTHPAGLFAWRS